MEDKIAGLTVGGDDYLTKPFSLDELIARVRAVLRRARPPKAAQGSGGLSYADLEIDEDAHLVRRHGTTIHLSPTEFNLLRYLVSNAGRVVSKQQIVDHVWEYDFGWQPGCGVHVHQLPAAQNRPVRPAADPHRAPDRIHVAVAEPMTGGQLGAAVPHRSTQRSGVSR